MDEDTETWGFNDKPRATQPALCQTRIELESSSIGMRREKNGSTELWQRISSIHSANEFFFFFLST